MIVALVLGKRRSGSMDQASIASRVEVQALDLRPANRIFQGIRVRGMMSGAQC